jgi:hypothetical protein
MKLKTKLSLGLGFLFVIIFTLIIFCLYYIGKISTDSENILKDNYKSVIYARNMSSSIDDMNLSLINQFTNQNVLHISMQNDSKIFESAKNIFDKNLSLEKNNITETNEKENVEQLIQNYDGFIKTSGYVNVENNKSDSYFTGLMSYYQNSRKFIDNIYDVNMQAIIRKNQFAEKDAENMKMLMALVGTICILLAFGYFWYFPFYVSNSIAFLANKMTEVLKKAGIEYEQQTKDESFILLNSIDLISQNIKIIEK